MPEIDWLEILADGKTHHVVMRDGVLYIDGAEQGTAL